MAQGLRGDRHRTRQRTRDLRGPEAVRAVRRGPGVHGLPGVRTVQGVRGVRGVRRDRPGEQQRQQHRDRLAPQRPGGPLQPVRVPARKRQREAAGRVPDREGYRRAHHTGGVFAKVEDGRPGNHRVQGREQGPAVGDGPLGEPGGPVPGHVVGTAVVVELAQQAFAHRARVRGVPEVHPLPHGRGPGAVRHLGDPDLPLRVPAQVHGRARAVPGQGQGALQLVREAPAARGGEPVEGRPGGVHPDAGPVRVPLLAEHRQHRSELRLGQTGLPPEPAGPYAERPPLQDPYDGQGAARRRQGLAPAGLDDGPAGRRRQRGVAQRTRPQPGRPRRGHRRKERVERPGHPGLGSGTGPRSGSYSWST